jgi:predicted phosphodiesterase
LKAWGDRTAANAQPRAGTVFTPDAAELLRRRLRAVLEGPEGAAARADLQEAADEHLAADGYREIAINRPVSAPELPFALAEALPRPPRGLEYRFAGDRLLLRDESTNVLVDYVAKALPQPVPRKQPSPSAKTVPTGAPPQLAKPEVILPNRPASVKFAVLGDTGAGNDKDTLSDGKYRAYAVAKQLEIARATFVFPLALMLGDNMYTDPDSQKKYAEEVVEPYKSLRAKGVVFRAVLGNHDTPDFQLPLAELNFENRRFYAFEVNNVRFLILHSNEYVKHDKDPEQDAFIKKTLGTQFVGWTIAAFHHPLYSSGLHRNQNKKVREAYKTLLDGRVRVAFTGHEHFYERTKPKPGPAHFVSGAAAKLREGDIKKTGDTDKGVDDDHSFMLVEIDQDEMYFEVLGLSGRIRDCGVLPRVSGTALSATAAEWLKGCQAKLRS